MSSLSLDRLRKILIDDAGLPDDEVNALGRVDLVRAVNSFSREQEDRARILKKLPEWIASGLVAAEDADPPNWDRLESISGEEAVASYYETYVRGRRTSADPRAASPPALSHSSRPPRAHVFAHATIGSDGPYRTPAVRAEQIAQVTLDLPPLTSASISTMQTELRVLRDEFERGRFASLSIDTYADVIRHIDAAHDHIANRIENVKTVTGIAVAPLLAATGALLSVGGKSLVIAAGLVLVVMLTVALLAFANRLVVVRDKMVDFLKQLRERKAQAQTPHAASAGPVPSATASGTGVRVDAKDEPSHASNASGVIESVDGLAPDSRTEVKKASNK